MFYRILNKLVEILTVFFLSIITAIVPVEVLLRYCFGKSLYITEDLTRYLMVWVVFLASSLALRDNSHVSIGLLVNRFRGRTRSCMHLAAQGLLIIFLIFLITEGIIALSFQTDQIIPTLQKSMFWFYLAIPVGSALMILNLLPKILDSLKSIFGRTKVEQVEESALGNEPGGFL